MFYVDGIETRRFRKYGLIDALRDLMYNSSRTGFSIHAESVSALRLCMKDVYMPVRLVVDDEHRAYMAMISKIDEDRMDPRS
jgi:hypothetical protein